MIEKKRFTFNVDYPWLQEEAESKGVSIEVILERIVDTHVMNHPLTGQIPQRVKDEDVPSIIAEAKAREDRHLELARTLSRHDCVTWTTKPRHDEIMVHEGQVKREVHSYGYWDPEGEWTRDNLQDYDLAWRLGVQLRRDTKPGWMFLRGMTDFQTGWVFL